MKRTDLAFSTFTKSPVLRVMVLGALLLASAPLHAQSVGAFELRAGVVVDPTRAMLYAMSPGGGLDAVSLDVGLVQWHSDEATRPLAASPTGLLAMVESFDPGTMELVLLSPAGAALQRASVALPAQVMPRVADGLGQQFTIRALPSGAETFDVAWSWTSTQARGALILDQPPQTQSLSGTFSVDMGTSNVVPGAPSIALLEPPPILAPPTLALPGVAGTQFRSVNGNHVLASQPGTGAAADTYEWTIYDPAGRSLGTFTTRSAYVPFFATDTLAVYESGPAVLRRSSGQLVSEPLMLRAIALSSGVEQWTLAIRGTDYEGPLPP